VAVLTVEGLCCIRSRRLLFEDLSFSAAPGDLIHIEGPNGAGKTSLLRILCGLREPQAGQITWDNLSITTQRSDFHRQLLFIGHQPGVKNELSPLENLRFYCQLQGLRVNDAQLEQALEQVDLYGFETVACGQLSAGQRRRVGLARLWLATAPLWILDEPFTALDRQGVAHLEARFSDHAARGGQVILSSHQPPQLPGLRSLSLL